MLLLLHFVLRFCFLVFNPFCLCTLALLGIGWRFFPIYMSSFYLEFFEKEKIKG